jgi:hypothetical protein
MARCVLKRTTTLSPVAGEYGWKIVTAYIRYIQHGTDIVEWIHMSLPWSNSKQKQLNGGKMSRDEYYANTAARLDTIIGGDTSHFLRLQRVKNEYDTLAKDVPIGQGFLTFYDYVKEYYGVKLVMDGDNLSLEYAVIDEKKYTMFLLKFDQ